MEALLIDRESSPTLRLVEPDPVLDQLPAAERLNALAGHLNAVNAAIVDVVADAIATDAWGGDGIRSPEHWLCWQLGITTAEARRLIGLAKARETHPVVSAMFDAGQLSMTQATIATSVDPTRDQEVAELVTACTIPQLRLFITAMSNSDAHATKQPDEPADAPTPCAPPERKSTFDFGFGDDGWLTGRFELDPESGRIVDQALRQARDMSFHQHNAATDPEADVKVTGRRVTWADALTEVARRSLDGDESPTRRERFRINLFIHPDSNGGAAWEDRSAVPDCLLDKLTCDGRITPTFVDDAKPVSVGRALRIVPDRARRLVLYRDGHQCRIPWCQRTRWLDVHHVVHWNNGGPTDTDNLIAACGGCHTAIHDGRISITGNADDPFGLTFTDRHGNPIDYRTPTPPEPAGPPPEPERAYAHPLGERLDHNDVWVNPPRASAN